MENLAAIDETQKSAKYREIIWRLLAEYHEFLTRLTKTPVETEIIRDDFNGQYMVMRVGWRGAARVRRPAFYLRLKADKIWIEEDWMQEGIAQELEQAGVAPDDIVYAFHALELPLTSG